MTHSELLQTHSKLTFSYSVPVPPMAPNISVGDLKIWFTENSFTVCPTSEKVTIENCIFVFPYYTKPDIAFECPLDKAEPYKEKIPIKVTLYGSKHPVTAEHAMYRIHRIIKVSETNVLKLENKKVPFNDPLSLHIYGLNRGVLPLSVKDGYVYALKQDRTSGVISYEPIIEYNDLEQLCIECEKRPDCLTGLNYPFTPSEFISLINNSLPLKL